MARAKATTRATKRAGPGSGARREAPPPLEWLAPFSPTILRTRVPKRLLAAVVAATDALLGDEAKCRIHAETSPVLSNVDRHVSLPDDILSGKVDLGRFIEETCEVYVRRVGLVQKSGYRTRLSGSHFPAYSRRKCLRANDRPESWSAWSSPNSRARR